MAATSATRKKDWQRLFLVALEQRPDVSQAAAAAGVSRSAAYRARQSDEDFAIKWHDAMNASLDKLEAALFTRGTETDTTAAIFLLKSHRRETYGERLHLEHAGQIKQTHDIDLTRLTADEKRAMLALVEKANAAPAEL